MLLADGARHTRHWSGVVRLTVSGGLQQKLGLAMYLRRDFRCALVPRDGGIFDGGSLEIPITPGPIPRQVSLLRRLRAAMSAATFYDCVTAWPGACVGGRCAWVNWLADPVRVFVAPGFFW